MGVVRNFIRVTISGQTGAYRRRLGPWRHDMTTIRLAGEASCLAVTHRCSVGPASVLVMTLSSLAAAFRFYDPSIGRWLSEDPSGLDGGVNLFGYAVNNPIRFIDPLGLWPWDPLLCFWYERKCIESGLACKKRIAPNIYDASVFSKLFLPTRPAYRLCFADNPVWSAVKKSMKTAVTPMGDAAMTSRYTQKVSQYQEARRRSLRVGGCSDDRQRMQR